MMNIAYILFAIAVLITIICMCVIFSAQVRKTAWGDSEPNPHRWYPDQDFDKIEEFRSEFDN